VPKKEKYGRVVSTKAAKTAVVEVLEYKPHDKYNKIITETKKYMANDENSICKKGDEVRIVESRPVSKNKCWKVAEVVKEAS